MKAGHEVISASDGEEGLRLTVEQTPDLVVLDMMIPKLPGPEVLRALGKNPATASIPLMVLTSLPQCNAEKLLGEGAAAYFEKSLLALEKGSRPFLDAVERILARSARRKLPQRLPLD